MVGAQIYLLNVAKVQALKDLLNAGITKVVSGQLELLNVLNETCLCQVVNVDLMQHRHILCLENGDIFSELKLTYFFYDLVFYLIIVQKVHINCQGFQVGVMI